MICAITEAQIWGPELLEQPTENQYIFAHASEQFTYSKKKSETKLKTTVENHKIATTKTEDHIKLANVF